MPKVACWAFRRLHNLKWFCDRFMPMPQRKRRGSVLVNSQAWLPEELCVGFWPVCCMPAQPHLNHRMVGAGRNCWRSSGSHALFKQEHLQHIAQVACHTHISSGSTVVGVAPPPSLHPDRDLWEFQTISAALHLCKIVIFTYINNIHTPVLVFSCIRSRIVFGWGLRGWLACCRLWWHYLTKQRQLWRSTMRVCCKWCCLWHKVWKRSPHCL